jgi:hypothetical protein
MENINESAPSEKKVEVLENPPRKTSFEELIRDSFFLEIFHSPVLVKCGHSFEKEGIEEQYQQLSHTRCPECNTANPQQEKIDNVICKNIIEFYLNLHPEFKKDQYQPKTIQETKETKSETAATKKNFSSKSKEDKNVEVPKKKTFEDLLICPLTQKIFFNPITLPCTHTFELGKLMEMLKNDCVNCPSCKTKTHKSDFIINFLLRAIVNYRLSEIPQLRDQQYFPMRSCLKILSSKLRFADKVTELAKILGKQPWGLAVSIGADDLVEEAHQIYEGSPLLSYFTFKTENFEIFKHIVKLHPSIISKEFLNSSASEEILKNVPIIAQFAKVPFTHPFILKQFSTNPKLMELDTYNMMLPNYGENSIFMFTRSISGLKILNEILTKKPDLLTPEGWLAVTGINSLKPKLNALLAILLVDSQTQKAESIKIFKLLIKNYPNLINFESFNYTVTEELNKGWNVCNSMAAEPWGRKFLKKLLKEQPELISLEALTVKCRMNENSEVNETDSSSVQEVSITLPKMIAPTPEQKMKMFAAAIHSLPKNPTLGVDLVNTTTKKTTKVTLDLTLSQLQKLKPATKIVQYNALVWLLEDETGKEILKDLAHTRPDLLISAIKVTIVDKVLTITADEKKFLSSLLVTANKNIIAADETAIIPSRMPHATISTQQQLVPAKAQPRKPAEISPAPVQTQTSLSSSKTTQDSKNIVITEEIKREISELMKVIQSQNKNEVIKRVLSSPHPTELLTAPDNTADFYFENTVIKYIFNNLDIGLIGNIGEEIFRKLDPNVATKILESVTIELIEKISVSDRSVKRMIQYKKDLQALIDLNIAITAKGSKPDMSLESTFSFTDGSSSTHFSRTSSPTKEKIKDADFTLNTSFSN